MTSTDPVNAAILFDPQDAAFLMAALKAVGWDKAACLVTDRPDLLPGVKPSRRVRFDEVALDGSPVDPEEALARMRGRLPPEGPVLVDMGWLVETIQGTTGLWAWGNVADRLAGLLGRPDPQGPARLFAAGEGVRAEDPLFHQRLERIPNLPVEAVAPFRRVGGRLDVQIDLGTELPVAPHIFGQRLERRRFGDGDRQVLQPVGEIADRGGIVDHGRRDLIGGGLPVVAGPGLIRNPELLDVDPDLSIRLLAESVGKWGPAPMNDQGGGRESRHHDGQAGQSIALPGQSVLSQRRMKCRPKLDPSGPGSAFTGAHGWFSKPHSRPFRAFSCKRRQDAARSSA